MADQSQYSPFELEDIALEDVLIGEWAIVLFNDDINTFDWVIDCLMKYCNHESVQAEQCAWIVHTKGKCRVKNGSLEELQPVCSALLDAGLSAKLEN